MVLEAVACKHCGKTQLVQASNATDALTAAEPLRRFGRSQTYTHKARDPLVKEQIMQMVLNGAGIRDTARVLGVNRNTVSAQFKKSSEVVRINPL